MSFWCANFAVLALLWQQHFFWATFVFFLPAPWYAWQVLRPSARGLGPVVTSFSTARREVWLTIDDGPDPASTPAMLELLAQHQAKATFFLIGQKALQHPHLVSEILRHGHSVGNHSFRHLPFAFWIASAHRTGVEIDKGADALRKAGADSALLFRSPIGLKNYALHPALSRRNMDLVLWSARGYDAVTSDAGKALARIKPDLKPGAIVLVHETPTDPNRQKTLVSGLLAHLQAGGYRCVIPPSEALIR